MPRAAKTVSPRTLALAAASGPRPIPTQFPANSHSGGNWTGVAGAARRAAPRKRSADPRRSERSYRSDSRARQGRSAPGAPAPPRARPPQARRRCLRLARASRCGTRCAPRRGGGVRARQGDGRAGLRSDEGGSRLPALHLAGLAMVMGEWALIRLTHNVLRLFPGRRAAGAGVATAGTGRPPLIDRCAPSIVPRRRSARQAPRTRGLP